MFFRHPVTPVAPWSFMFGMLMIFVSRRDTSRMMFDRVSSSPKRSASR